MPARRTLSEVFPGLPDDPEMSVRDKAISYLCASLMGTAPPADPAQAEADKLREVCRAGNPFPLIAYQWPELVLKEKEEIALFQTAPPDRIDKIPAALLDVAFSASNPPLRLDWWQKVVLAAFFAPEIGEIYLKGATGVGKGAAVSIGFCLWFDAYEESRCMLSSRDYSHAITGIFGEVKMWMRRMKSPFPASILGESVNDTEHHYIKVLNPSTTSDTAGEAFSGHHGKNTLFGFDEATASPTTFFENAERNARKIIALANPRTRFGRFHDSFKPLGEDVDKIGVCPGILGNRLCVTIAATDCLNVRYSRVKHPVAPLGGLKIGDNLYKEGERIPSEDFVHVRPLIPQQIDLQQFRGICKKEQWYVDIFGYGKFPKEDPEKQIILASWLERHEKQWAELAEGGKFPAVEAFGLDIGASTDGDPTCLTAGGKDGVRAIHRWKDPDTMSTVARVLRMAKEEYLVDLEKGRHPITVDVDGVGKGVADQLRRLGCWVLDFHGNVRAEFDPQLYGNLRAEAYALLGRRLNPLDLWRDQPWAMPPDENLRQELCAPEKVFRGTDGVRFFITPKTKNPDSEDVLTIKEKLHRSPDSGDAVAYLFHAVRLLHNLHEWMLNAQRALVVYPVPPNGELSLSAEELRQKKEEEKKKLEESESEVVRWLAGQYGDLLGKEKPADVPDWKKKYAREAFEKARAEKEKNGNGNSPSPASPKPKEPSWAERIQWADD